MTRLIDADALRDTLGITGTADTCKGCKYNDRIGFACNTYDAPSFAYVCEAIDDAPTVEAIPIEYIRERMNGFYDHGYNEFGSALEALIMDWEEENGTDNQF